MHEKNEILPYNTSCCPILDSHICYYFYSWKASLYRTHSENKIFPAKFSEFFKTKFYFIPSPKWYVTSQGSSTPLRKVSQTSRNGYILKGKCDVLLGVWCHIHCAL